MTAHYRHRGRRSKYNATKTVVDGITFASKAEARRYGELKVLERAGEISDLKLQPRFDLYSAKLAKVGTYLGDFSYTEFYDMGVIAAEVVEDVKGVETPLFKRSWKHVNADYPDIEFRKVKA